MKREVEIFDISYDGAGVGKLDGKIVFVPKTLSDEIVEVEIEKENSKFCVGKIKEIKSQSPFRKNPLCPYFDVCGGCDFQHCDYEKEVELKKQIVSRELKKAAWENELDFQKCDNRFFYRNKIKLEVFENRPGYFKKGSKNFFEIECCPIATKEINDSIKLVKKFLSSNDLKELKSVYIKQVDEKIGICFLFDKNSKIDTKKLKNIQILQDFLIFFAFGDILESNFTKIVPLSENFKLVKNIFGEDIENDISSFNQINDEISKKLYDYVCEKTKNKNVINAYSGQGLLTAMIAKDAKSVLGIEFQKNAHISAEKLKNILKMKNMINICGKVENEISKILEKNKIDLIVLDPARAGCQKNVLEEIKRRKIDKILYISCNFSSLVRDLRILQPNYTIKSVKIFDMFPCTANVEVVSILERA